MMDDCSDSDTEIKRIDNQERKRKRYKKFELRDPDDTIRCLNAINESLSLILVEIRRLHDVLDYIQPNRGEKE